MKITGLDKVLAKLDKIQETAKSLDGSAIPLEELLNPQFLQEFSRFQSLDEMFAASGYNVESSEDFKAIPDEPWDVFIENNTEFSNWSDMSTKAAADYFFKKAGL